MRPDTHARLSAPPRSTRGGTTHRGHALAHDIQAVVTAGEELLRTKADLLFSRVAAIIAEPPPGRAGDASDPAAHGLGQAVLLIYELLDAHDDTARLAGELARDPDWHAHLQYLRALQRTGREVLAHITTDQGDG
jgi:hypothetical protein